MPETHINGYKAELVTAERELSRAQGRVNWLREYIENAEGVNKTVAPVVEVVEMPELEDDQSEEAPKAKSRKGTK